MLLGNLREIRVAIAHEKLVSATEDPSTKESHYEKGKVVCAAEATNKIKHFRKAALSDGKTQVWFVATIADTKAPASDNCKTTLGTTKKNTKKKTT